MTARPLYIVGASGLAREMAQLAEQIDPERDRWHLAGFIGRPEEVGRDLGRAKVVGDDAWLVEHQEGAAIVVAIGDARARDDLLKSTYRQLPGEAFPNLIHPTALIDLHDVEMGVGNCVTAGCIFTCNIRVGDFNLFNWNVTVGHDAVIGSCNVLNPGVNISGSTRLGDGILVGTGAQLLEGRSIASRAIVGAGAVVTKHVGSETTVVGVPARPTPAQ
jgi:sugar O-acyltransferase (sialic acid O-acetyltransferase NeuD family)